VLGNKTLLALAERAPRHLDQLSGIDGMTPGQMQRYGAALLSAIAHGQKDPVPTPPRRSTIDPEIMVRYEKLRAWRKQMAAQRGVEPDVVVSNAVLLDIATRRPRTLEAIPAQSGFGPWRRRTYGQAILKVMADS
jgi:ribonuclease D